MLYQFVKKYYEDFCKKNNLTFRESQIKAICYFLLPFYGVKSTTIGEGPTGLGKTFAYLFAIALAFSEKLPTLKKFMLNPIEDEKGNLSFYFLLDKSEDELIEIFSEKASEEEFASGFDELKPQKPKAPIPVIIVTATKLLQNQIIQKDIHIINRYAEETFGFSFNPLYLIGKSNYTCLSSIEKAIEKLSSFEKNEELSEEEKIIKENLDTIRKNNLTTTEEIILAIGKKNWEKITEYFENVIDFTPRRMFTQDITNIQIPTTCKKCSENYQKFCKYYQEIITPFTEINKTKKKIPVLITNYHFFFNAILPAQKQTFQSFNRALKEVFNIFQKVNLIKQKSITTYTIDDLIKLAKKEEQKLQNALLKEEYRIFKKYLSMLEKLTTPNTLVPFLVFDEAHQFEKILKESRSKEISLKDLIKSSSIIENKIMDFLKNAPSIFEINSLVKPETLKITITEAQIYHEFAKTYQLITDITNNTIIRSLLKVFENAIKIAKENYPSIIETPKDELYHVATSLVISFYEKIENSPPLKTNFFQYLKEYNLDPTTIEQILLSLKNLASYLKNSIKEKKYTLSWNDEQKFITTLWGLFVTNYCKITLVYPLLRYSHYKKIAINNIILLQENLGLYPARIIKKFYTAIPITHVKKMTETIDTLYNALSFCIKDLLTESKLYRVDEFKKIELEIEKITNPKTPTSEKNPLLIPFLLLKQDLLKKLKKHKLDHFYTCSSLTISCISEKTEKELLSSFSLDSSSKLPIKTNISWHNTPKIFTSATLRGNTNDGMFGFKYFLTNAIGFTNTEKINETVSLFVGKTPFDFKKQALVYVPQDAPVPTKTGFPDAELDSPYQNNEWVQYVLNKMKEIPFYTTGGVLVLLTNKNLADWLYENLAPLYENLGLEVFSQTRHPMKYIMKNFGNNPEKQQILFSVQTYWQGLDLPGEKLQHIIIPRLPFEEPDSPYNLFTRKKIVEQVLYLINKGKIPASPEIIKKTVNQKLFWNYQLPKAILLFKQGIGRLIRTEKDVGLITILDGRMKNENSKKYSYINQFAEALPMPKTEKLEKIVEFLSKNKIAGKFFTLKDFKKQIQNIEKIVRNTTNTPVNNATIETKQIA